MPRRPLWKGHAREAGAGRSGAEVAKPLLKSLFTSHLQVEKKLPKKLGAQVALRKQLTESDYDDKENNIVNNVYFKKRSILFPTNVSVDEVNDIIYDKIKGKEVMYRSKDLPVEEESM